MTTEDSFFPKGYEVATNTSKYAKIEKDKELKIRILSKPIIWFEYFMADKKPNRSRTRFEKLINPAISPFTGEEVKQSEFWAFTCYNYWTKNIEIFQTTKTQIKNAIMNLYMDADFWEPTKYDLKIKKTGEKTDTVYHVTPISMTPISKEIQELFEKTPVNLEALFDWKDPFSTIKDEISIEDNPF